MFDCKYYKQEISNKIVHEFCSNDVLKEINNSRERDIHCIGMRCGKFEKNINTEIEVK